MQPIVFEDAGKFGDRTARIEGWPLGLRFDQVENDAVRGMVEVSDGERRVIGAPAAQSTNARYPLGFFD